MSVLRPDDLVVAVCDNAHEHLADHTNAPATVVDGARLHWSVPDPTPVGPGDAFDRAFRDLAERVDLGTAP